MKGPSQDGTGAEDEYRFHVTLNCMGSKLGFPGRVYALASK